VHKLKGFLSFCGFGVHAPWERLSGRGKLEGLINPFRFQIIFVRCSVGSKGIQSIIPISLLRSKLLVRILSRYWL
jgi:hypothetical protein